MKKTLSFFLCLVMLFTSVSVFGVQASADKPLIIMSAPEKAEYLKMEDADLAFYMDKALALKEEIINSPTTVTWTGTAYYVSNSGNDNNDGLTPETAKKSLSAFSGASFLNPGDAVLLKRGDTFRITGTFSTREGVTYSTYGTGAKPKVMGSIDASAKSLWEETEYPDVYRYKYTLPFASHDIGNIAFDMGRAWGIKMQDDVDNGTISNGLETFKSGGHRILNAGDLKNDLEFWLDRERSDFYLKSVGGHPSERFASIEMAPSFSAISGTAHGVTIDNWAISGVGVHGIGYGGVGAGAPRGLTVQYCTFDFIGGSVQNRSDITMTGRLGNAVEIYGGAHDYEIHHCYAQNVYDCCWTVQYQSNSGGVDVWFEDIDFHDNVACYSNTGLEVWLNNKAEYQNDATYGIRNMRLHDNYTFFNGYGWSQQRPNKDGNIFYGDPSITTSVYENCSVDNNVGMFASKWINYLRYVGTPYYNFNNNVYFQHDYLSIGGIPEDPLTAKLNPSTSKPYDEKTMNKLIEAGLEPGTKFYYTSDYKVPEYEPEIMNFSDVGDHWATKNIEASVMRGYMNGVSADKFSPNGTMTRAMLVTVLSRITDVENIKTAPYTDINRSAWYATYVDRAYTAGLVAEGTTKFRPDDAVTREELADMLYRFTRNALKTKDYSGAALNFTDKASVTPSYAAGIAFAIDNGIISGYPDGSVKPQGTATRAEVATMIRRFVDFYAGAETDYSQLTDKTDSHVFTYNGLAGITVPLHCDKRTVNDNGADIVKLLPASIMNGYPTLSLYERFAKISFADYPYVKIRYKLTGPVNSFVASYTKGEATGSKTYSNVAGEWNEIIVGIYDLVSAKDVLAAGDVNGTFSFKPWGETGVKPSYNEHECAIDYVGFFPSLEMAEAYKSNFEANAVTVDFYNGETLYHSAVIANGTPLKYPEVSPKKTGYTFEGWSVAEGTPIKEDTKITAILTKLAGAPNAMFDTNNATASAGGGVLFETKSEDGIDFFHFTFPSELKASADGTRAFFNFNGATDYDLKSSPVMKICYRTNIESSSAIDFNPKPKQSSRVWGPNILYTAKGKWVEQTVDISKMKFIGGEGIEQGLSSDEIIENYLSGQLHSLCLKPFLGNGLAIKEGEYFDVAYVAFFPTVEDANLFTIFGE